MSYAAPISRTNPTAFLFIIDQSGSMSDRWGAGATSKAQAVSDALNKILAEIVTKCSRDEGVRHYFDVGVIGYGGHGYADVLPGAGGPLMRAVADLERLPLRVEDRKIKIPDGAGGVIDAVSKFPVWFDPQSGGGTPMVAALGYAAQVIGEWCDAHRDAYPPTVIHITDGESGDGDAEPIANLMRQLHTSDGNVLLFNLHISSASGARVLFPSSESEAPTEDARRLYQMSSELPPLMLHSARGAGYEVGESARGYGYNADFTDLVAFFDIGTRPANLPR